VTDDAARIRQALDDAGIAGAKGFVVPASAHDNVEAARLDERAALPVLVRLLPTLTDPATVIVVAGLLCHPFARPDAFDPLLAAFRSWAPRVSDVGEEIGRALATTSSAKHRDVLLGIAANREYGPARRMIVGSLWRYRKDDRVKALLTELIADPDVSVPAMNSLRRSLGNGGSVPILIRLRDESPNQSVRKQAAEAIQQCLKAVARSGSGHRDHGLGKGLEA